MKKRMTALALATFACLSLTACGGSSDSTSSTSSGIESAGSAENTEQQNWQLTEDMLSEEGELDVDGLEMNTGELLSIAATEDSGVVIKAKIQPSFSNSATINQNYYNVYDLITENGFNLCDEIQYWAVADMSDGSESKVISFTIDGDIIDSVEDQTVTQSELRDYATDEWVLPSLLEDD